MKKKRTLNVLLAGLMIALFIVAPSASIAQQGGTTQYVYDKKGRLKAVVTPSGEAAIYEYDAAGNFTAIRRNNADTLELLAFDPHEGAAGDRVTFVGTGFGAGVSSVSFNGTSAPIVEVTPSRVVAEVPSGASTGPVTITTTRGTVTTPEPFVVTQGVRVSPGAATLVLNQTLQFTAIVSVPGDPSVTWSVNGVVGGSSSTGTITASGLYTAPATPVSLATVRATSIAQPSLYGEARVSVRSIDDISEALSPQVTVFSGFYPNVPIETSSPLSVLRGMLPEYNFALSHAVSVTNGPHVGAISPAQLTRNTTTTVTITGANLTDASAIRFITSGGAIDTAITVSNISVSGDGVTLTCSVTVSSSAATGIRVVVVSTPVGPSVRTNTGLNTITIQ